MRKSFFAVLLAFITLSASAQSMKNIDKTPLNKEADFKTAEPKVKEAAEYLLSHPVDIKDESSLAASRFLILWMTGTPDYSFGVDGDMVKFVEKNTALTGVFMAAMVKVALDKPELAKDAKKFKIASYKVFADYCANDAHKVEKTVSIKSLIEANKKGKVESVLDMSQVK
ncbi:MAG: hypothetical protein JWO03_3529 [Bacteroidetes bacterium]|nr:hypothetical protein [Bacteroidota bacterium]